MITYNLDITPGAVPPVVHVSQYDKGLRAIQFKIYNGDKPLSSFSEITTGVVTVSDIHAYAEMTKPDRKALSNLADMSSTSSGIFVTVKLTEQMTTAAGDVRGKINFSYSSGNAQVASAPFILAVDPAGIEDSAIVSESDLPELRTIYEQAQYIANNMAVALQSADRATNAANSAQANADKIVKAAETAQKNADTITANIDTATQAAADAKDYANQASASLNNLKQYTVSAEKSANLAEGYRDDAEKFSEKTKTDADNAKAWTVGPSAKETTGTDTTNARYYANEIKKLLNDLSNYLTDGGVVSFNGRSGNVVPVAGDYSADEVTYGESDVKSALDSITSSISSTLEAIGTECTDEDINTALSYFAETA